jgi:phosphatidylserine synthase
VKPNTKSPFFKLSLVFVALFFVQTYIEGKLLVHDIKSSEATNSDSAALVYWLGLVWLAIAATLYYKTTRFKQTRMRQFLVFITAPFVFAPLAAIVYVILVLLPAYGQGQ